MKGVEGWVGDNLAEENIDVLVIAENTGRRANVTVT